MDWAPSTSSFRARPGTTRSAATSSSPGRARSRASSTRCRSSSGTPTSALPGRSRPPPGCRRRRRGSSRPARRSSPPDAPFVVKPSVSAGGRSSAWFAAEDEPSARARRPDPQPGPDGDGPAVPRRGRGDGARLHRRRLLPRPPPPRPASAAGDRAVFYLDEELGAGDATAAERDLAEQALGVRARRSPVRARRPDAGMVLELEATEPSLYLQFGPDAAERCATAIARVLRAA